MFVLCALEVQNMKNEILESHHEDKPLEHKKTKTLFTLNQVPTMNNKQSEINVLQQILERHMMGINPPKAKKTKTLFTFN
jgi:hypothetical protein